MINNIELRNFRSYSDIKINLSQGINVFIGKNAQGKTNLLEAIYFISNVRSHRTKNDKDLIKINRDYSRIIINREKENLNEKIMCVIHSEGKFFSINDNAITKTSDILGRINTVLFFPNETRIFSDAPSLRRIFFDVEIGKVNNNYTKEFKEFNNFLKERNKLLKEDNVDQILLDILTKKIVEKQLIIIKERKFITDFINQYINEILSKLSEEKFEIKMNYQSTVKNKTYEDLLFKYESNKKRDIHAKTTTEGIHRDDYEFKIKEIEISKFLSQGQIRLVLLAIKLVLIDYIYLKTKNKPVLLLDDVFSELDKKHQIRLIKNIPTDLQTIITTTYFNEVFKNTKTKKYLIRDSKIFQEEEENGEH